MTSRAEETGPADQAKTAKKGPGSRRRADGAPAKDKVAVKGKKAPKEKKIDSARAGSKAAQVLELLKRQNGASLQEIMNATDWQAHTVRGFLSGVLRKKLGLAVESAKGDDGERTYSVKPDHLQCRATASRAAGWRSFTEEADRIGCTGY